MALKAEIIKANAVLATLTAEQITTIENLSKNDEDCSCVCGFLC